MLVHPDLHPTRAKKKGISYHVKGGVTAKSESDGWISMLNKTAS